MPRLAVFPKAYMKALCLEGTMKLADWIRLAEPLDVEGLEWYAGFLEMRDRRNWKLCRAMAADSGKVIPMMCCSPDFTHPDKTFREREIEKQKHWIEMTSELGGTYCRVLSGQRRPSLTLEDGISLAVDSIEKCLPFAAQNGITLIIENHYKDDFWEYPEFVQKMEPFCELVSRIVDPNFGVNYDPSNAFLAGDDPVALLRRIKHRVVTMHASDRYLKHGTLADLAASEGAVGYASMLAHGEIGKGLNNYDKIFAELKSVDFNGWISIEDGIDGMDQLERSVTFLRRKVGEYWGD